MEIKVGAHPGERRLGHVVERERIAIARGDDHIRAGVLRRAEQRVEIRELGRGHGDDVGAGEVRDRVVPVDRVEYKGSGTARAARHRVIAEARQRLATRQRDEIVPAAGEVERLAKSVAVRVLHHLIGGVGLPRNIGEAVDHI